MHIKMGKFWHCKLVIIWVFKRFLFYYYHNCTPKKCARRNYFIFSCFVFLLICIPFEIYVPVYSRTHHIITKVILYVKTTCTIFIFQWGDGAGQGSAEKTAEWTRDLRLGTRSQWGAEILVTKDNSKISGQCDECYTCKQPVVSFCLFWV